MSLSRTFSVGGLSLTRKLISNLSPATLWTPAELSLLVWYDASESSSVTLNGSTVSAFNDLTATGHNLAQALAASQPTYQTASLNGLNTMSFDGGDFLSGSGDPFYASDLTIFTVAKTNNTTTFQMIIAKNAAPTNREFTFGISNTNRIYSNINTTGAAGGDQNALSTNGIGTDWVIFGSVKSGVDVTLSNNGDTNPFTYTVGTIFDGNAALTLGRNPTIGFNWNGEIAETLIADGAVSSADRERIEGYLAWKWGLQANLPVSHPYKDAAPTL